VSAGNVKRRAFFSALAAVPAMALPVKAHEPERALVYQQPCCPCGRPVMFEARPERPTDLVPVVCGCGWRGVAPIAVRV